MPKDVLKVYGLATQEVRFARRSLAASARPPSAPSADVFSAEIPAESNNWVVAGKKSSFGHAILASDPHLEYVEPSVRYLLDLNAPTLHVIGAKRPIPPGVSLGHNDWIAFAHTSFPIDQEDLYVYELNPANPEQYKYQGEWEPFQVVNEEIKVKGQTAISVELKFTLSALARGLVALLQHLSSEDVATKVWFSRRLRQAFKEAVLNKPAEDSFEAPDAAAMLDVLEHPETRFAASPVEERDQVLPTSLSAAYHDMETLHGLAPRQWRWGKLHHNLSEHPPSSMKWNGPN